MKPALVGAAFALLSPVMVAARTPPVHTRKDEVVDHAHGVAIADPYRWLEDGTAPEVRRWTAQENALTRKTLDAFPGRAALAARFWALYEIGSLGTPVPRGRGPEQRLFYARRDGKQNQPVLYARKGVEGADQTLVDVNALAADGTSSLDWWYPSEDGARVAYGVSRDGSEESVLRVRDVASRRDLPDEISRTRACSVAWTPDGRGFFYTRYPAPGSVPAGEEKYHRAVFFHRLGADPAADEKIFGEGRELKDWPSVALSPDGRWLAITVSQGWSKSEVHLIDVAAKGPRRSITVAAGEDAEFDVVELLDDRLYLRTNSGAPRNRLYLVELAHPERARWREIIPEGDDIMDGVVYFARGTLAVTYLHDASSRLRLYTADGQPRGELPLPSLGTVAGLGADREGDDLYYGFTSFLTPTVVFRHVDIGAGAAAGSIPQVGTDPVWRRLASPIDPTAFEVERVPFTSRDGTRSIMFLVHKKGLARDGARPTLLTGYGGFNISMQPTWTPSAAPFLEQGGVFALAILRGGGEFGEAWHQAGMLGRKQNVFDDFIAAAEALIAGKVTSPAHLAISGRSNGGLLVGAALTQRPDLFRAVVCGVPLLDMLRYDRFRIARLWIPEYGAPADPQAFKWLRAYSPYHHVTDGTAYPAVLFQAAESDTRVDPMHARKMTARLQAATGGKRPILLRFEDKAGHGAGKPLAKTIEQITDEWSFLFSELGIEGRK